MGMEVGLMPLVLCLFAGFVPGLLATVRRIYVHGSHWASSTMIRLPPQ
jgi:hypothetical protein